MSATSNEKNDTSFLDKLSADELEKLIQAELVWGETANLERLTQLVAALNAKNVVPPIDVNMAWDTFCSEYIDEVNDREQVPISDAVQTVDAKPIRQKQRVSLRIIPIAAVLAVLLCGLTVAQAAGADIFGAIGRWTADVFQFEGPDSSVQEENEPVISSADDAEYTTLQDALDAYGVTEALAPSWIPEGFQVTSVTVSAMSDRTFFNVAFENGTRFLSIEILQYNQVPTSYSVYEKDDSAVSIYEEKGITHYIMSNLDTMKAVWAFDRFECVIQGDVSEPDLKSMIDSIYER